MTLAGVVVLAAVQVDAATLFNSDFSSPGTDIADPNGPISVSTLAANTWILGGHDGNQDDWDIAGGVASNDSGPEAQALLQYVADGGATTGAKALQFDFRMSFSSVIGGDYDLSLHVFGWNAGDSAPGVDPENGAYTTGDSFVPNDSVNLIADPVDDGEGRLDLAVNGSPAFAGVLNDGNFNMITVNLDFQSGFDYFGVLFYAESGNAGNVLAIDNVQVVPGPCSLALLTLGSLGFGAFAARRRRRRESV